MQGVRYSAAASRPTFHVPRTTTVRQHSWRCVHTCLSSPFIDHGEKIGRYLSSQMHSKAVDVVRGFVAVRHTMMGRTNQIAEPPYPLELKPPTSPNKTSRNPHIAKRALKSQNFSDDCITSVIASTVRASRHNVQYSKPHALPTCLPAGSSRPAAGPYLPQSFSPTNERVVSRSRDSRTLFLELPQ
jgi:hypothetical protein